MASSRVQFNVRMTDDTAARMQRLHAAVSRAVGVPITQAQLFALAVAALEDKHRAHLDAPPAPPRPRGRPRKTPATLQDAPPVV